MLSKRKLPTNATYDLLGKLQTGIDGAGVRPTPEKHTNKTQNNANTVCVCVRSGKYRKAKKVMGEILRKK